MLLRIIYLFVVIQILFKLLITGGAVEKENKSQNPQKSKKNTKERNYTIISKEFIFCGECDGVFFSHLLEWCVFFVCGIFCRRLCVFLFFFCGIFCRRRRRSGNRSPTFSPRSRSSAAYIPNTSFHVSLDAICHIIHISLLYTQSRKFTHLVQIK